MFMNKMKQHQSSFATVEAHPTLMGKGTETLLWTDLQATVKPSAP